MSDYVVAVDTYTFNTLQIHLNPGLFSFWLSHPQKELNWIRMVLTGHLHADAADPEALDMLIPLLWPGEKWAKRWMDGWASVYANAAPGVGVVNLRADPGREVFRGPSSRCSRPAQAAPIDPVDE